ncbi:Ger(x)C family spore germination protein [Ectobacillus sp. JY-23]|uniref:Ger(x)C family spore germination protein n=1 Tax=Ectobacillus sp. JY-23 TaxID=2933872 RepID=UPI001FF48441|nr:Ger(x)C family spore germination protein [Ectobacillus sp. JY-23]UOY94228.1 Ger(x)C family spore germination protein [Ectobacillus sp. JY-23]
MGNTSKLRSVLLIGVIIATFTGRNIQENTVNSIAVVSGIGVDKSEGKYIVTLQLYNPAANRKDASDEVAAYTYKQEGETVQEAIQNMYKITSRRMFLQSAQIVVFSERLARDGLSDVLNYLIREPNVYSDIKFMICKDISPYDLFRIFTPVSKVSSSRFKEVLERGMRHMGYRGFATLEDAKEILTARTTQLTVPYISVVGNPKEGFKKTNIEQSTPRVLISLEGVTVFRGDRLYRMLSFEESIMYRIVQGQLNRASVTTGCPHSKGRVSWKLSSTKSVISVISERRPYTFRLGVQAKANIYDITCKGNLADPIYIKKLEKKSSKDLQVKLQDLIRKSQTYNTDFIGFSDAMYHQNPSLWRRTSKQWSRLYPDAKIEGKFEIKLINTGDIIRIVK